MYIILADSGDNLMKLVFVGIIIFIASIGQILKLLGIDDSKQEGQGKRSNPRSNNEDMENARRRLREMMREQGGSSLNPNFPKAPNPVLFEEEVIVPAPKKERSIAKPKAVVEEDRTSAYHQNSFDYNAELLASEKLLAESMIAFEKVAKVDTMKPISVDEIRGNEIVDLMHDKKFLKKSIVISEILDKPLSLRMENR